MTKFVDRHIGPSEENIKEMLTSVGFDSMDQLTTELVPDSIALRRTLNLPDALSESDALDRLRRIASKNKCFRNFIGQGYYGTHTPLVIQRNVLENPCWYSGYTPYQAEIS